MAFSIKNWVNGSGGGTPISEAALEDMESRLSGYTDTEAARAGTAEALKLAKASNLSDLASASTARTNLGLGTAATQASSAFDAAGTAAAAATTVGARKALGIAAATPEEHGAKSESGHDDAAAITEAIAKVVEEGQANSSNYGEVWLGAKNYRVIRAPVEGGATKGNAQIPLPVISPETAQKFTLVLKGVGDATAGPHFHQEVAQGSGTVLDCMLTTGSSGSSGAPSVIGGPTKFDDPSGTVSFSNMLLVLDGITIRQQLNPVVIGVDARQLAACNVGTLCTTVRATVAEMAANLPTNELGIGLYGPLTGNNDDYNVDLYTSYGHYTSIVATEHLQANRIAQVYGNTGFVVVGLTNEGSGPDLSNQAQHGAFIAMLSSEGMKNAHVEAVGDGEHCRFPLVIGLMSCESGEGTHDIIDPEDILLGQINWENVAGEPGVGAGPRVSGGKRVRIVNLYQAPGVVAAPSVPATTVEIRDTLFRDSLMPINGGTGLEVFINGTKVTGFPTTGGQPILWPAGGFLKLVYSGAPTFGSRMLA